MTDHDLRELLLEQIDRYYAYRAEYGNDMRLTQVEHDLARKDLESWDLRGLVPVSVWLSMPEYQQRKIKDEDQIRLRFIMFWMAIVAAALGLGHGVAGPLGIAIAGGLMAMATAPVMACLLDAQGSWSAMMAPGTASSLKHTKRLYTEANAQLTRQGMRGALTADDDVQVGGELTMTNECGALEVCDE